MKGGRQLDLGGLSTEGERKFKDPRGEDTWEEQGDGVPALLSPYFLFPWLGLAGRGGTKGRKGIWAQAQARPRTSTHIYPRISPYISVYPHIYPYIPKYSHIYPYPRIHARPHPSPLTPSPSPPAPGRSFPARRAGDSQVKHN